MPIMGELLHVLDASREPWTFDLRDTYPPLAAVGSVPNFSAMTHPSKTYWHQPNGPKPCTEQWVDQGGKVHHWAAYIWYRPIDISAYEGDTRTCLRALALEYMLIMSELLHVLYASCEPWTPDLRDSYSPPTTVQNKYTEATMQAECQENPFHSVNVFESY